MDIFKLIYEHDLRLDNLRVRHLDRDTQQVGSSIEDFLKPDPTYSKFYITGTALSEPTFGLNRLQKYDEVLDALAEGLSDYQIFSNGVLTDLKSFVKDAEIGTPAFLTNSGQKEWDSESLTIDSDSNIGHKKSELAEILESGDLVLYKEQAQQGFDLHLFSKKNIYTDLFYPLKNLVSFDFRFFSINGKKITSERKFYFETWTLDRPPHGAEEVFSSTVL
tara:strand:+ start:54020 stop:54679 length:660 start_codon:yes stop_codon:yes gene_type:complete